MQRLLVSLMLATSILACGPTQSEVREWVSLEIEENKSEFVGPRGIQGIPGEKGEKGERGPRGFTGQAGIVGHPGPQGERGPRGFQGIQGERGEQGVQGIQGEQGSPGVTIYITPTPVATLEPEVEEQIEEVQDLPLAFVATRKPELEIALGKWAQLEGFKVVISIGAIDVDEYYYYIFDARVKNIVLVDRASKETASWFKLPRLDESSPVSVRGIAVVNEHIYTLNQNRSAIVPYSKVTGAILQHAFVPVGDPYYDSFTGLGWDDDFFYTIDCHSTDIIKLNSEGVVSRFDTNEGINCISHITVDEHFIWVQKGHRVFVYTKDGIRKPHLEWILDESNSDVWGMAKFGTLFYLIDRGRNDATKARMFVYDVQPVR